MQPSKLHLENYFVEEVSFNLQSPQIQDLDENPKLNAADLDIEVRLGESKDNENGRFCQLSVKLKDGKAKTSPYKFKIVLAGFFEIDSACTNDDADLLMTNTAPSMLYTAAREYLLVITGRTRFFPVMLPTVLFTPKTKQSETGRKTADTENKKDTGGRTRRMKKTEGK